MSKRVEMNEVATTLDGRDITLGYVNSLPLLPPGDTVLAARGGSLTIYEELLRDDQVAACLAQRRLALVGADWEVVPGGDKRRDKAAAEFLEDQLRRLNWDDITDKMLFGVFFGYAVAEVLWARDAGRIVMNDIRVRRQRRFGFAPDGSLRLLTMARPLGEPVPDRKFWHYRTGGSHGDDPYGIGLAQALYWPVMFKRHGMKFWLIFLEKFGMPTAKGKFPQGASPEDRTRLLQALEAIQTDSGIAIPEGMEVDLIEAARSGTADYAALQERMDAAIAKVILGQTASTQGTPGKLGNETLQTEVRRDIIKADADLVCGSFNRQVARWLTEWNFPGAATPRVRRVIEEPEDLKARAERDKTIVDMGFKPSIKYITETYGGEWSETARPAAGPAGTDAPRPPAAFAEGDSADAADRLADQLERESAPVTDAMIDQARKLLDEVESLEEFADRLPELVGTMDIDRIGELMGKALMAADLTGQYEVSQGD